MGEQQWRKLTVPQQKVLIQLSPDRRHYFASYYPPIRKLISLGLVTGDGAGTYRLTDEGRAVLGGKT